MLCVFYRKYYVNCLDMTCNIDNFAAGKWFREVYAFRMKREPGKNPGQYRCCESTKNEHRTFATGVIPGRHDDRDESEDLP